MLWNGRSALKRMRVVASLHQVSSWARIPLVCTLHSQPTHCINTIMGHAVPVPRRQLEIVAPLLHIRSYLPPLPSALFLSAPIKISTLYLPQLHLVGAERLRVARVAWEGGVGRVPSRVVVALSG